MIYLLGNVSPIHFKCNMGHIQFMFHIYYTELVAYKSWNNIVIVFCVMPPWLSGRPLDKKFSIFWSLEGPWFESWFLAIFGHFISTLQHHFAYKKVLLFLQKWNLSETFWRMFNSIKEHWISTFKWWKKFQFQFLKKIITQLQKQILYCF